MAQATVGSRLTAVREQRGLTVPALAHRAHVSPALLLRLEQNRITCVTGRKLPAIARALAIDLDALLDDPAGGSDAAV